MRLFYNGIELKVLSTLPGTKRVVMRDRSGLHYLYTKWVFDVICLYNPAGTTAPAALAAAFPLASVVTTPGPLGRGSPAFTDSHLRDLLRQDRKQLLVFSEDGQYVLQSPQPATGTAFATLNTTTGVPTIPLPTMTCDATGGPRVMKCDIVEVHGIKSYTVHFQIETDVCEFNGAELLSHSWDTRLSTDQDGLATRQISGELKFKLDELERLGRIPDNYRPLFGHPVPQFFARTSVDVFDHEDKCTVNYQVTDTQRHFNLGLNSPATRFEAFLTGSMENPGVAANKLRIDVGVTERFINLGATYATGRVTSAGTGVASALVEVGTTLFNAGIRLAFENCPKYTHGCTVRAWGPSTTARVSLMQMCLGIAYGRLGLTPDAWRTEVLQITHELSGKFVEVQLLYSFGLEDFNALGGFTGALSTSQLAIIGGSALPFGNIGPIATILAAPRAGPTDKLLAPFFLSETLASPGAAAAQAAVGAGAVAAGGGGGVWASQTVFTQNRPLPVNRGTTGSWLGSLVAQVLYEGGVANPPAVPAVSNREFVNPANVAGDLITTLTP